MTAENVVCFGISAVNTCWPSAPRQFCKSAHLLESLSLSSSRAWIYFLKDFSHIGQGILGLPGTSKKGGGGARMTSSGSGRDAIGNVPVSDFLVHS